MCKLLSALLIAFLTPLAQATGTDCFGLPPTEQAVSKSERKALTQSKQRLPKACKRPDAQCQFRAFQTQDGGIGVAVELAVVDQSTGKCLFPLDAGRLDTYTADGRFVRSLPR
jgi:hypothetical protein